MSDESTAPRWDPGQYLRHADHRLRPLRELLDRVADGPEPPTAPGTPLRVADLGCGPGTPTRMVAARFPGARVTGWDNSREMLEAAREHAGPAPGGGLVDFARSDLADWRPAEPHGLIVSNAALQWIPGHAERFPKWVAGLLPGGVLAFQVPDNFDAPSHVLLRELCASPRWRDRLGRVLRGPTPILDPDGYHDALAATGCSVDLWTTEYRQLLTGPDPVLEWTRGTALRPVLTALADAPAEREAFSAEYAERLRGAYPRRPDGTTVFPFRRLFAVARRPAG
ncbi:trans-aconitate 2-methyltransferase [Streptomyces alkaliphilus]|uniref:trans-aconitate 2-methyltransferase n=1 Tax=Streptomyces alkaliphilus TaxID=1472722 RepID=UPI00117DF39E|nr:trans-aconitate 2-methyltransferase [Streptomyces alkaliphilus]MQS07118.1 trans-aconitate 2-methyltransferase [Streptomyces alkaliphilus]